jgi:hypothetical protein
MGENIKIDLKEIGCECVYLLQLTQDGVQWQDLVNTVMEIWVLWKARNFLTSSVIINVSTRPLLHGVTYLHCTVRNGLRRYETTQKVEQRAPLFPNAGQCKVQIFFFFFAAVQADYYLKGWEVAYSLRWTCYTQTVVLLFQFSCPCVI